MFMLTFNINSRHGIKTRELARSYESIFEFSSSNCDLWLLHNYEF